MRIKSSDIKNEPRIQGQVLTEFILIMPILVLMMLFVYHLHTVINTGMNGYLKQRSMMMNKIATNGTNYQAEEVSDVKVKIKDFETKTKKDVTLSPAKIDFDVEEPSNIQALTETGQNGVSWRIREYYSR